MIDELAKHPFILSFQKTIEEKKSSLLEGLNDSAKALLIYFASKHKKKHVLVISAHESSTQLIHDIAFFTKQPPIVFPAWEALPGEDIAPSIDIVGMRTKQLQELMHAKTPQVVITSLQGAMQKVLTPQALKKLSLTFKVHEEVPFSLIPEELSSLGYTRVKLVSDKGQFAVRGGIVDLFPSELPEPVRIEFFGDQIEEIRTFDPMSQKSTGKIDTFSVSYADEKLQLKSQPLATLFDYLKDDTIVVFDDLLALEDRFVNLKAMPGYRSELMMHEDQFFQKTTSLDHLFFCNESLYENSLEMFGRSFVTERLFSPFTSVHEEDLVEDAKVFGIFANESEEEALKALLPKSTTYLKGYLSSGFVLGGNLVVFPYTEWSKRLKMPRQKWRNTFHTPSSEFHELNPGDLVVHFHNGIGIFRGIETQKNHLGIETEFLIIEYAEKSKLFVPISQSHLV
ncbi:MAG: transcription-repair coupling factor, partial [Chlamydiae bacterium]|nr:transcription-repair coupling factor [Chlamydiota bacterium]